MAWYLLFDGGLGAAGTVVEHAAGIACAMAGLSHWKMEGEGQRRSGPDRAICGRAARAARPA